jgi:hypothetical protein
MLMRDCALTSISKNRKPSIKDNVINKEAVHTKQGCFAVLKPTWKNISSNFIYDVDLYVYFYLRWI